MQIGTVVMATLPEGSFSGLTNNEAYRIGGVIKGNSGEISQVRIVGVSGYWPVEFFAPIPEETLQKLIEKAKEALKFGQDLGIAKPLPKSIVNAVGDKLKEDK